jgi:hypothetical protein
MGGRPSPDAVNNYIASLFARLRPCFARSIDSLMLRAQLSRPEPQLPQAFRPVWAAGGGG